ncbi:MAG: hypothetical protein R3B96_14160 [Pirellulaceae bacterium]
MRQFSQDDLDLIMSVAGQAAGAFENAMLLESFIKKQKQDGELNIAKDIQRTVADEVSTGRGL